MKGNVEKPAVAKASVDPLSLIIASNSEPGRQQVTNWAVTVWGMANYPKNLVTAFP
jgi:hypothetical protein